MVTLSSKFYRHYHWISQRVVVVAQAKSTNNDCHLQQNNQALIVQISNVSIPQALIIILKDVKNKKNTIHHFSAARIMCGGLISGVLVEFLTV